MKKNSAFRKKKSVSKGGGIKNKSKISISRNHMTNKTQEFATQLEDIEKQNKDLLGSLVNDQKPKEVENKNNKESSEEFDSTNLGHFGANALGNFDVNAIEQIDIKNVINKEEPKQDLEKDKELGVVKKESNITESSQNDVDIDMINNMGMFQAQGNDLTDVLGKGKRKINS